MRHAVCRTSGSHRPSLAFGRCCQHITPTRACNSRRAHPDAVSHRRMVLSLDADTSWSPVGTDPPSARHCRVAHGASSVFMPLPLLSYSAQPPFRHGADSFVLAPNESTGSLATALPTTHAATRPTEAQTPYRRIQHATDTMADSTELRRLTDASCRCAQSTKEAARECVR